MHYNHTQIGYLMIFTLLMVVFSLTFTMNYTEFDPAIWVILMLVILLLSSFATLNVAIDEEYLQIKFGWGIYRKKFVLKEIVSAKTVKNKWYYGWGIRYTLKPRRQIFNVSGFDAVEVVMKNGKIYRIGTDEPEALEFALRQVI